MTLDARIQLFKVGFEKLVLDDCYKYAVFSRKKVSDRLLRHKVDLFYELYGIFQAAKRAVTRLGRSIFSPSLHEAVKFLFMIKSLIAIWPYS